MMVSFLCEKDETRDLSHTKGNHLSSHKIALFTVKYVTYSLWM